MNKILNYIADKVNYLVEGSRGFFIRRYDGPSVEEIAEGMKPVPIETIKDKLPSSEFTKTIESLLERGNLGERI
jgi:hypothetical protein